MIRILIFIAAVLGTCYLAILYKNPILITLFFTEFLVVLPSAAAAWIGSRKLSVKIRLPLAVAERDGKIPVELVFQNKSRVLLPSIEAELLYENRFHKKKFRRKIKAAADGKSTEKYNFFYEDPHCGKTEFKIRKIRCYDWLHLFRFRIKSSEKTELVVMPKLYEILPEITETVRFFPTESDSYDRQKSGDDPSEVFQIREYRPGDRMQRIHWKMTARTDELIVRDFSLPLGCAVVFFLQVQSENKTFKQADAYLDAVFSISSGLTAEGCRHYIVWYDEEEQQLLRFKMEEPEDLFVCMEAFFRMRIPEQNRELRELYEEQFPNEPYAVELTLDRELQLFKGEEMILQIDPENAQDSLQGLELIL